MISAVTTCAFRNKSFFNFLPKLEPKPDIWIIYCDNKPIDESWYIIKYKRVADNYNKIKKLIPEISQYTLIMEDDAIVPNNALDIHLQTIKSLESIDAITFPFYTRSNHLTLQKKIENTELMIANFKYYRNRGITKLIQLKDRSGLKQIETTSLNFVLIKSHILNDIQFQAVNKACTLYIDNLFFLTFKKLGYKLYCNFDIPTIHLGAWNWPLKQDKNQEYSQLEKDRFNLFENFKDENNKGMWIFTCWVGE